MAGGRVRARADLAVVYGTAPGLARGQLHPRAVPLYNALHRFWGPLALAVVVLAAALPLGYVVAALAWAGHIAFDRAIGLRPRTADGFQRGDKRMTDVLEVSNRPSEGGFDAIDQKRRI